MMPYFAQMQMDQQQRLQDEQQRQALAQAAQKFAGSLPQDNPYAGIETALPSWRRAGGMTDHQHAYRILLGELGDASFMHIFLDRRHVRQLLATRDDDDVLILGRGGLRIRNISGLWHGRCRDGRGAGPRAHRARHVPGGRRNVSADVVSISGWRGECRCHEKKVVRHRRQRLTKLVRKRLLVSPPIFLDRMAFLTEILT
jgi:hypothetical protein